MKKQLLNHHWSLTSSQRKHSNWTQYEELMATFDSWFRKRSNYGQSISALDWFKTLEREESMWNALHVRSIDEIEIVLADGYFRICAGWYISCEDGSEGFFTYNVHDQMIMNRATQGGQ